jgi:hypothetical protein
MSSRVDRIVTSAVVETLENMAFMEVLAVDEKNRLPGIDESISVRQQILAPVQGDFHLLMPRALAAMIAATIFTVAMTEVSEQHLEDVATELLNTIAGKFLNDFLPTDATYKLGLPAAEMAGGVASDHQVGTWSFLMAGQSVIIAITEDLLEWNSVENDTGGRSGKCAHSCKS